MLFSLLLDSFREKSHEYCCHLCEETREEHHALCSRNFLCDSDDTPPDTQVTVTMGFVKRLKYVFFIFYFATMLLSFLRGASSRNMGKLTFPFDVSAALS